MFNASDLVWGDFESASTLDLKAVGSVRYATDASTRAIVLAYAIGDAPAETWHANGDILDWDDAPDDLRAAVDRGAILAAWNASFNSAIWNYATLGFPFLEPERVIDPMIQAGVSNLPTDLESASRALGGEGKRKDGKKLIKLFCVEGTSPRGHLEEWQRFLSYARQDVEAMREVYRRTRPLPLAEWQQYWAFEHINRRGVAVDVPFVVRAAALAAEDVVASGRRLAELTDKVVTSVSQAKRLAAWLRDQLADAAMREALMVDPPADDEGDEGDDEEDEGDDEAGEEPKLSLTRDRVARVLAMLEAKRANGGLDRAETKAREAATLRLYGAGAAPKKFARLATQQVEGVLRDQYRFAGASQTGRMSSKSAQVHNITRDVLGKDGAAEASLVDMIADGGSYAALAAADPVDVPVARKLALLVRPALIATPPKTFVWSDWSAIEARVLPWLAASPGADAVLDIFRANDADPTRPDIYTVAAADILHKDPNAVTKTDRNIGKVACLALGFGGSVGALQRMALNYRIRLEDAEARRIVDAWRSANSWAPEFWNALWGAAMRAWELPGQITTAGRLAFVYREDYLAGSLFMALPSGRWLTYPRPKWRDVDVLDKDGKPTGERRHELSYRRGHGRVKLWRGTLAENATQACAADVLRETVTRIETNPALSWMPIRLHTHDEIVCEVEEARAEEAKAILRREMLTLPEWAEGLPLQSEEQVNSWYSKAKVANAQTQGRTTMPAETKDATPELVEGFVIACRQADLAKALALLRVTLTARQKRDLPILSHVLFRPARNGEECVIIGTDGDARIERRISCVALGDHRAFALPRAELSRDLPSGNIQIEVHPGTASIGSGATHVLFDTMPPEDFPAERDMTLPDRYSMKAGELAQAIKSVSLAISTEETRYYLNGAYFHCRRDGWLRLVATDGHRMVINEAAAPGLTKKASPIIVPAETLRIVKAHCIANPGAIGIASGMLGIEFTFGGLGKVRSRGIDGAFPDYARIIPRNNDKRALIDRQALDQALRMAPRDKRKNPAVIELSFDRTGIAISNENMRQEHNCEWNDKPFAIRLQASYLRDALSVLGDTIEMAFSDPASPVLMMSDEFPKVILMPTR